jgi:hypothetical protein
MEFFKIVIVLNFPHIFIMVKNLLFRSRWTKLVIMINLMCGRLVACCMKHVLLFHPSLQPIRSLLQQRLRRDDSVQYHHTIPSHLAIWFLSCLE